MFSKINQQIGSNLLVINNLTTSTVLDVALSVEQNKAFEKIAEHADSYGDYLKVQYHEGLSQANNIVISCMSGVGVSQEIKNILDNESNNNIEIITMEYAKLKNLLKYKKKDYFKNTKFIITTVDFPGNSSVPIINIYGILDGDGTRAFKRLLIHSHFTQNNITDIMSHLVKFFSIAGVKNRLHILNPDVVIDDVESIVKDYEAYYGINLSEKIKLNLYMHIALMLERTVLSHDKEDIHSSENRYTDAEKKFMQISKHIFTPIDIKYNLTVSNDEIMLIYEILMSEIVPEN
jgi:transcriptional regulatory protein LevR